MYRTTTYNAKTGESSSAISSGEHGPQERNEGEDARQYTQGQSRRYLEQEQTRRNERTNCRH